MRWQGRRESDNVEDRRGQSGSPFGGGGGGGFRLPSGKGGIVLLIIVLVAGYYGVDLTGMLTGEPMPQQQTSTQRSISPKDDEAAKFTSVILATTEDTWGPIFEKMGRQYPQPKLVLYRGATRTGCGTGQSVMGPFYCPADSTVYIDLSFYDEMKNKLGADGDFAQGTSLPMKWVITYKNCWALSRRFASNSSMPPRPKPTACRLRWSCRQTASPASGVIICSSRIFWKPAICRRR
jgi:predicted metalloprotease